MSVTPPGGGRPGSARLKREVLGTGGVVFLVLAAAAPLTVLAGVAPLAIFVGGIGAPVAYLAAGAVFIVFAVGFTAMTRHTAGDGAFYSYITLGLGRTVGMASGLLAVVAYNALQIGVYGLLAAQVRSAVESFAGLTLPWPGIALLAVILVGVVGRQGIDVGARLLGILLIAESAILALLAISVVVQGGNDGLSVQSFSADAVFAPGMAGVLAFGFAAFMGFESTAVYRSEARDPGRTISRATYVAVVFLTVFYGFVVWAVIQAFGDANVVAASDDDAAGLFFNAIEQYVGIWASDLMHVLVLSSIFASQVALHNAINRYTYSLARDGVLPSVLARTHPVHHSPRVAGAVQSVLAGAVILAFAAAGADPYLQLLLLVNTPGVVGIIVLQLLTSVAVVAYFVRNRRTVSAPVSTAFALLAAVLLTAALVLLVAKIDLLTDAGTAVNVWLVGLVPLTLLGGVVAARIVRRRLPHVYARVGALHDVCEEDASAPRAR